MDTFFVFVNLIIVVVHGRILMRWKLPFALTAAIVLIVAIKMFGSTNDLFHRINFSSSGNAELHPVVLELFTSEGCSSCPPADAFLKSLDDAGSVNGIAIIALEEHVDYWNRLGWTDPFSSRNWTDRQEQYARSFRRDGSYTPQLVINGRSELVGSYAREAKQIISDSARIPGAEIHFASAKLSSHSAEFSIAVEKNPFEARSAQLWLAVAERGLTSNVVRGENEGRNLVHAAVLRSLTRVPDFRTDSSGSAEAKVSVPLDPSWKRENLRFVVFLQEPRTLHIFGAAASPVSP
jgi:hypothetical protein